VEDVLAISHGRPALETMKIVRPDLATEEEHERFLQEEEALDTGSLAIPGAVAFVRQLPEGRWGVVTSAPGKLARQRLQDCGFPPPPVLVTPEDVTKGKPDPEPYRLGAERLRVAPPECFVVEDAPAGLISARAAGMVAIGITTTYGRAGLGAEVAVPDFEALEVARQGDTLLVRVLRQSR
jgi:sugar-phosphatase